MTKKQEPQIAIGVADAQEKNGLLSDVSFRWILSVPRSVVAELRIYGEDIQRRDIEKIHKQINLVTEAFDDEADPAEGPTEEPEATQEDDPGRSTPPAPDSSRALVLELLAQHPQKVWRTQEIVEKVGIQYSAASHALTRLTRSRLIEKVSFGHYRSGDADGPSPDDEEAWNLDPVSETGQGSSQEGP